MSTILVVDDSPTDTHVLKTILDKNGYKVLTAPDGESGIQSAKLNQPDLILMDVVMPGLNGFQTTRKLSKDPDTLNIPVIIVTTKDQDTDRIWGLRQGAVDYIVKPVDETELIEKITPRLS